MNDRPRGTVTFLFTDIEGSTRILSTVGPDRYGDLLGLHQDLIRAAIDTHNGHEIDTQGDAFFVAFERPGDAVSSAIETQRALADQAWPAGGEIRVRMGIHTAEATTTSHGYVGVGVHRAARICAVGHGGQVLVSQATHDLLLDDVAGYRLLDLGEHQLKDFHEPQRLFQLTADGLATDFPPLRSGISTTNLPAELTSFVGRQREAEEIRALLDGHRLVSLVGVGGTGKTRLMLRVADEATSRHADGAWLIELAPLREPDLVIEEVVRSLGVQVGPGQSAIGALTDFLRDKDLLLLLDNCEHLIDAAAALVERMLGTCRSLQILTTSREALGVPGEATFAVPSLGLPAAPGSSARPSRDSRKPETRGSRCRPRASTPTRFAAQVPSTRPTTSTAGRSGDGSERATAARSRISSSRSRSSRSRRAPAIERPDFSVPPRLCGSRAGTR
jgi:class 3 adenylate cyclase